MAAGGHQSLARAVEAVPGAIFQFHRLGLRQGRLLFMSAGAGQIFDRACDSVPAPVTTDLEALAHGLVEADRAALTAALDDATTSGNTCTAEFRVRSHGAVRWLRLHAVPDPPLPDGGQTWNGLILDISELKATQDDLGRLRDEWCATVDSVKDMIVLEDSEGRIARCNLAASRFLGLPFRSLIGRDLHSAFFGPGADADAGNFRKEQVTAQFPGCADWFEISNVQLRGLARRGAAWAHVIANVTQRRRFEEEARRLSAAIEQTGEMLLIVSRNGELLYANPAYRNAAGLDAERLVARRAFSMPLAPRQELRPILAAVLAGRVWRGTFAAIGPDGSVHQIEADVAPVRTESGATTHFVCVARDVTEPRRLEAIADAVNMVDQVGFVFATLRHELGNPINSVKTALTVLHQNLAHYPPEMVSSYLERSLAEIARMEYLLRAFKSFGAFERPRLEPVAAARYLNDFANLVRGDLERRGIVLETQIEADLGQVHVDPRAFSQALLNLVTNAADAVAGSQEPRVRIAGRRRGRRLEVVVQDNGCGVAAADLANLFKPFFTTKAGGTGLGLTIVRKLLSQMSSIIDVESERGSGTMFTLSLPSLEEETR